MAADAMPAQSAPTKKKAVLSWSSPRSLLLLALTFTSGMVDAVSYLGLGKVFTALMTGNVVFLAFSLSGAPGLNPMRSIAALSTFALGAVLGGRIARKHAGDSDRRWFTPVAIAEVLCLVGAALAALPYNSSTGLPISSMWAILALSAFAMGLRSATVRKIADPDLKATVLTLTITGIAADPSVAGGDNTRVMRRLMSVGALFLGGLVGGALVLHVSVAAAFALMAVIVALATVGYLRHPSSKNT